MTRMNASTAQKVSLEVRRLSQRLVAAQGKSEMWPQLSLDGLVAGAENKLALRRLSDCADMLDQIDRRVDRHLASLEEAEMASAGAAQDQLLAERGIETAEAGVVKTRDGWVWLKTRKPARLTATQVATGTDVVNLYTAILRDELCTSANDNERAANAQGNVKVQAETKLKQKKRLDYVRQHIVANVGHDRLWVLLIEVCGRGNTLRSLAQGDDRRAAVYEVELRLALDMAAVAFKSAPKVREDNDHTGQSD